MLAEINRSFLDYAVENYNFGIEADIYDFPKPIQTTPAFQYNVPVIDDISFESIRNTSANYNPVIVPVAPIAPIGKTISFTVSDANGTLPGANIAIDGIGKAQTNGNGYVVIPNVLPTSMVKISYVGYEDYVVQASQLPAKLVMKTTVLQLDEAKVPAWKKPTSNTWLWWLAGGIAALGIYKYSKTGAKVVKAKI
jgi:hypothetical protein